MAAAVSAASLVCRGDVSARSALGSSAFITDAAPNVADATGFFSEALGSQSRLPPVLFGFPRWLSGEQPHRPMPPPVPLPGNRGTAAVSSSAPAPASQGDHRQTHASHRRCPTSPVAVPGLAADPWAFPLPQKAGGTICINKLQTTLEISDDEEVPAKRLRQSQPCSTAITADAQPEPDDRRAVLLPVHSQMQFQAPSQMATQIPSQVVSQAALPVESPNMDDPPLSAKQELLLEKVLEHRQNVFFTGAAGTGKSRTLRELIRRSPEESTFVTALTGIAATNLPRGTTLHSFAGIGLAKGSKEECLNFAKSRKKAQRSWQSAKLLIIDEASMMSKALFEKIDYVARHLRKDERPFGGVVTVFCGDFFQLPPVSRTCSDDGAFCFESKIWHDMFVSDEREKDDEHALENCFALTEVFRQKDASLLDLLSEVRHNNLSHRGFQTLTRLSRELPARCGVEPTKLFPTNARADAVNRERLAALPGGEGMEASYDAEDVVPPGAYLSEEQKDQMSKLPRRLDLKVGAQVVLLKNYTPTLVNGSRGTVESFTMIGTTLIPVVRFINGEVMVVRREKEDTELPGRKLFQRFQVPLRLSWAITIHKSQGMTIDFLEVDLQAVFEKGQAYVALSRARTLDGLRVVSFDPRRFWTDDKVAAFYKARVRPI